MYGFFVKGEALQGTISDSVTPISTSPSDSAVGSEVSSATTPTDGGAITVPHLQLVEETLVKVQSGDSLEAEMSKPPRKRKREHDSAETDRQKSKVQRGEAKQEDTQRENSMASKIGSQTMAEGEIRTERAAKRKARGKQPVQHTSDKESLRSKWQDLSKKKQAQYIARAAEKGQSPEEYYSRRLAKKAKIVAAGATADKLVDKEVDFVIDTTGDPMLAVQDSLPAARDSEPLRWHPDMLGDREVKELTKVERRARLEWMHARQAARRAAKGRDTLSKKERNKKRSAEKLQTQDRLVFEALKGEGVPTDGEVSKEQLAAARKAAKRQMREMKRTKRNKVIHRKSKTMA